VRRHAVAVVGYEHSHPGALLHVDVKKLGNIPAGGGLAIRGTCTGQKNRWATPDIARSHHREPLMGHALVHTFIDDHSRLAYAEIHDDETAVTAIGVLIRAVGWFRARGVRACDMVRRKVIGRPGHILFGAAACTIVFEPRPFEPDSCGRRACSGNA
jgi:Integrase core domain